MTSATNRSTTARAIADITAAGAFGPGSRFVSFASNGRHDEVASSTLYGTLTVVDQTVRRQHRLVVKTAHRTAVVREVFGSDRRFRNETLFYERIVPFLLDCAMAADDPLDRVPPLCHYVYGRCDGGELGLDDMIVLEDPTAALGYRKTDHLLAIDFELMYMDYDHLVVALTTLAKFHGLSYRAKHTDPAAFAGLMAGIEETQFRPEDGEWIVCGGTGLARLFGAALDRMVERRGDSEPTRRFRAAVLEDATATMRRVTRPDEPLAVLCHGNFNRNRLQFRYDADGGRPVEAMPLDMATVRYGSPALDLSLLLYANASPSVRVWHWDALLDVYVAALSAAVANVNVDAAAGGGGRDDGGAVPVPDRAQLDAEMRDRALYGLAHACVYARALSGAQLSRLSGDGDRSTAVIAYAVQHYLDYVFADE